LLYDTRNNLFTPTSCLYIEAEAGFFSRALGGDSNFQNLTTPVYTPITSSLTLVWKADAKFSFGDMPFYLRPGISLRGIQARRYLGEHAAEAESELR